MALQNDFLPFATGAGANVLSQSAYAALSAISTGYQAGVAQSNQLNKTWRQSSIMAAVLAQLINNNAGQPAVDDGTTATLLANLTTAISVIARQNPVLVDTGTANSYVVSNAAPLTAYPTVSGLTIDVSIANTNTGASTLNVDGLGTKPILGLGLQPLQGNELPQKGVACLMYVVASTVNGGNGAWIVMECTGGAQQVAPATQSQQAPQLGQVLSMRARYTSNGSFTVPAGVTQIWVSGCAGGGGGGGGAGANGSAATSAGGGGGGAGQSIIRVPYTVTPGQIISITIGSGGTVGAGGAPGANSGGTGGAGGNTVIGSLVTLTGGSGGLGGISSGASGGTGGSGFPNGSYGDDGAAFCGGGAGASSPFGGGGGRARGAVTTAIAGSAASGFGAGGGGGGGPYNAVSASGANGGAGAPGIVFIEW